MADPATAPSNARTSSTTPSRTRVARVACKACHARRVRCDAADGQPCWHCRTRNTPCELIDSKRGKYARRSNGQPRQQRASRRLQEGPDRTSNTDNSTAMAGDAHVPPHHAETQDQENDATIVEPHQQDSQRGLSQTNDRCFFLGDSDSLSYIIELICNHRGGVSEPVKVHYPIPASIADRAVTSTRPQIEPLSVQEALMMPSKEISDRLIYSFFELLYPAHPVVDRRSFLESYKQGKASPLLLHTIYLVTFIPCDESLIYAAGFGDRIAARKYHYLRAKTLYDVDHETDRNSIAAALFLLGFWWNGPDDQKDTWYWLGCATTYAQSLGMHRSTATSRLSPAAKALRKRIWTRDRHTAACFGRPCRIRDEDCDVEPLSEQDFHFDDGYDETLIPPQKDYHVSYVLEMTKLVEILGDILIGEYSPRRPASERYDATNLKSRLEQWEAQLPACMQRVPPDEALGAPFWANMLHIAYQNYYILIFRPKAIEGTSPSEAGGDVWARRAADSITRMTEDLLAVGAIGICQMHILPAVFGALSIHTLVICRKDPVRRQLAGNKSRQCILALSELAKCWPVGLWLTKFFVNLMRTLTGKGSARSAGSIVDINTRIADHNRNNEEPNEHPVPGFSSLRSTTETHHTVNNQQGGQSNLQPVGDMGERQATDLLPQPVEQLGCDSFWAYDTVDLDLLLQQGLCPLLPASFDTAPDDLGL
ncbi:hypothetical protein F66182_7245 [Fusarium sp. NRRL 66182]|nr:hypothetical protein F66182_7245 [Fusarium sp. NRRL 66182]